MAGLRNFIVDKPGSIGNRARERRWELFKTTFPDLRHYHILDLGGRPETWLNSSVRPRKVTVLNLEPDELGSGADTLPHTATEEWLVCVSGDACAPPRDVVSAQYDLVFSNSLIEHVGGPARRAELASVISQLAPRYWVQTPYRYFPIEPHWLFPGFQFLPLSARARISLQWPLVHTKPSSFREAVEAALNVELLSSTELRYLFPGGTPTVETFAGLSKSIIMTRGGVP